MFCPLDGTKMWLVETYDPYESLSSCGSHEWLEFEDADGLSVLHQQRIVPPLLMFDEVWGDNPIQV